MQQLEPGHNLVVHSDPDIVDFSYETVLLRVADDSLTLALESLAEKELDVEPGREVYVTFVRPDALYRFRTRVLRVNSAARTVVLERNDAGIERIQRRTYFRMHVRLHVRTRRYISVGTPRKVTLEKNAEALDLSGGGALLRLDEPYQRGDLLELSLSLPDGGPAIDAVGRVIRVEKAESADGLSFRCGIEFVRIKESDRSRIVRFLFLTQAKRGG